MEDQLIIKLFLERSEQAISELSMKYEKLCKGLARRFLHSEEDIEECINDAYLAVWNSIPPQKPDPLPTYLCRIVKNIVLKKYRMEHAQKRNHNYEVILEEVEEFLSGGKNPENEVIAQEITREMNAFLVTLKEVDRVMFVQRYWFCCSVDEISEATGKSKNYVTVHLHRTREKLREHLKKEGLYE